MPQDTPRITDSSSENHQHPELVRFMQASRDRALNVLIWLLVSICIGLAGVLLLKLGTYAHTINLWLQAKLKYGMLLLLPIVFALLRWISGRFFPGSQGSGIPQTIVAMQDTEDSKKSNLLSIRIVIGKLLSLMGGLCAGASIGPEGPAVQVGASVGHAFYGHGFLKTAFHRRALVLAGGAAGIAAVFNAPLAGIAFAMEELTRHQPFAIRRSTLLTVIIAGLISLAIMGNYTYFGTTDTVLPLFSHVPAIFVCGILGGIAGGLFSLLTQRFVAWMPARFGRFITESPIRFAFLCGLVAALMGLLTGGLSFGAGHTPSRHILEAHASIMPWYYGIARFVSTLAAALSGIPGGLFAPSLSIGAGIGDTLSALWPDIAPHGVIIALLMAGYLSGVTRSPITAFMIMLEVTIGPGKQLLLALMATSLLASIISGLISPVPLYRALAKQYMPPAQDPPLQDALPPPDAAPAAQDAPSDAQDDTPPARPPEN